MTYLLDTNILLDVLKDRNGRAHLLNELSDQHLLACCSINVTELHMGMRPGEEFRTHSMLRGFEFYPITWEVARLAGDLYRQYRTKGQTLGFPDMTIAAVALVHDLVLITENRKHFPMPELRLYPLLEP